MSNKIVDAIRRTGRSASPTRQIVVVQGFGKAKVETVLSTKITKISKPDAYRKMGGRNQPVEQYAFRVGDKTVERFADATALVLRKHQVRLSPDIDVKQAYVKKAFDILAGKESLQTASINA